MRVVIVDYGLGNLNSIKKKISKIGIDATITSEHQKINSADKIILPGVGHFGFAVNNLKKDGIWDVLNESVLIKEIPILGICLGFQLMTKMSEEGNEKGFGWFDANVVRFSIKNQLKYKVPHMGWNNIVIKKESKILQNLAPESEFYFVHSYHIVSNTSNDILSETHYEYDFVSSLERENIFGLQFHPEKSHDSGELILKNFIML